MQERERREGWGGSAQERGREGAEAQAREEFKKDEREGGREQGRKERKEKDGREGQGEEGRKESFSCYTPHTHLGPSNSVDEGPILLHLLRGYNLCLSCGGLIVVKETDEALVCWALQCLFTDPGEKRILCLVLTPIGFCAWGEGIRNSLSVAEVPDRTLRPIPVSWVGHKGRVRRV